MTSSDKAMREFADAVVREHDEFTKCTWERLIMGKTVQTLTFRADEIVSIERKVPLQHGLPSADTIFKGKAKHHSFGGAGLYAAYFDDQLIYIGKFMGRKGNWAGGNVVEARWTKHIGTFSMRARHIGFSARAFAEITRHIEASESGIPAELAEGIRNAKKELLCRETGCMSTFSRFRVASDIWRLTNGEVDLSRFNFIYSKLDGDWSTEPVRAQVSAAETDMLNRYHPPGNTITRRVVTPLPSADELAETFESRLADQSTIAGVFSLAKPYRSTVDEQLQTEPEEIGAAQRFAEKIAGAPTEVRQFVDALHSAIAGIADADIEYTNVPDLRLRRLDGSRRGFINVATIEWQKRQHRFLLKTLLNQTDLVQFGLRLDRRGSSVLAHESFLDIEFLQQHQEQAVNVILYAHENERCR
jgi:hypothetical protein